MKRKFYEEKMFEQKNILYKKFHVKTDVLSNAELKYYGWSIIVNKIKFIYLILETFHL